MLGELRMRINEITEGWSDIAKSMAKGAIAAATGKGITGAKSAYNATRGQGRIQDYSGKIAQRWEQQQLPALSKETLGNPQAYKQQLDKFLSTYFGGDYSANLSLDKTDAKSVRNYILQATNANQLGNKAEKPEAQAAQAGAPAAQGQQSQQSTPKFAKGIHVTNIEPAIIQWKGKEYTIGDDGEWVNDSNKKPNEAISQFLTQQLQIAQGQQPSDIPLAAPGASAKSTATPPSPEDVINPKYNTDPIPQDFVQVDLHRDGKEPQTRYVHNSQLQSWIDNGWTQGAGDGSTEWGDTEAQPAAQPAVFRSNRPAAQTPPPVPAAAATPGTSKFAAPGTVNPVPTMAAPAPAPAKKPHFKPLPNGGKPVQVASKYHSSHLGGIPWNIIK